MMYQNQTMPNNDDNADETSLLFLTDVAASSSSLSLRQDKTVTKKKTMKQHPSIAVVAGGVAGFLLLAIAGGYYTFDTIAAPAPAPASASGSLSIASDYYDPLTIASDYKVSGSCLAYDPSRGDPRGDSFRGVSLHAFKQGQQFQTCYADGSSTTNTRCWSNSYYLDWSAGFFNFVGLAVNGWYECVPVGDAWVATDPLPDGSCGLPCTMFRCPADCDQLIISNNCCGLEYDDDD